MFSTLKQGNTVHVLEQTNGLSYKTGQITGIVPNYTGGIDMKVKVDDQEYEFKQLPYNQSVAKKDGSIVVTETKDNVIAEILKLKESSETILNNRDYYENLVKDCDSLLRQIDPNYDKELRRDEEIETLKKQISNMSQSLENIEKLLLNKTE